jgi:hypothetical protein
MRSGGRKKHGAEYTFFAAFREDYSDSSSVPRRGTPHRWQAHELSYEPMVNEPGPIPLQSSDL